MENEESSFCMNLTDCSFDNNNYRIVVIVGTVGWSCFTFITLILFIVVWYQYTKRIQAEQGLHALKFSPLHNLVLMYESSKAEEIYRQEGSVHPTPMGAFSYSERILDDRNTNIVGGTAPAYRSTPQGAPLRTNSFQKPRWPPRDYNAQGDRFQ